MSEGRIYPQWHFVTVPPYDWQLPKAGDVICVETPVSIFDIDKLQPIRIQTHAASKKFGYIVANFLCIPYHPEQKRDYVLENLARIAELAQADYIGCSYMYDTWGNQFKFPVSADEVLTVLGSVAVKTGAKIFYRVDEKTLEEKHIARIYQMIRGGQIDSLVVDGVPDEVSRWVLKEMEYLGVEVIVRPYDVR